MDLSVEDTSKQEAFVSEEARPSRRFTHFIKRLFDIVVSFVALCFLSPVFGLIAILIKRDTPGPVFYRGLRMGRGERS